MFNKKNDTLVDSVKLVMEQNQLHRRVEAMVNEHFGITSKNALPHERHAEYDAILAEAKKCAMEELKGNQHKIDMNKNNRIDAHDFKLLRAKKKMSMEEDSEQLDEKAKSEQQQKFFGLVRAIQKGKAHGSAKAEKAAKEMSIKSVGDYAKTKHEGLPKKVDEEVEALEEERKRTMKVADAFMKGQKATEKTLRTDGKQITYHGNVIAKHNGDEVHVTTAGYGTSPSTRGHVNGILRRLGAPTLSQKKGKIYHGNDEYDGDSWIKVKKPSAQKMDEEAVFEEIRNNLEEQLIAVFESGDEAAFNDFVSSLTEEQLEILGLNEAQDRMGTTPGGASVEDQRKGMFGQRLGPAYQRSGIQQTTSSVPQLGGGKTGVSTPKSNLATAGAGGAARVVSSTGQNNSAPNFMRDPKSRDVTPSTSGTTTYFGTDKTKPLPPASGRKTQVTQKTPTQATTSPKANQKPGVSSAARPVQRPTMPARPGTTPARRVPGAAAAAAQKRIGYTTAAKSASAGDIMSSALAREETETPIQVKESFEQFLRNKFLKD